MTLTEEYNKLIQENSNVRTEKIIKDLIEEHHTKEMEEGVSYYNNENKIINRKQYFYENGKKKEDEDKPNNKIPHNWHKLLVDQKMSYIVGQPIVFETEDESFAQDINEVLTEDWDDTQNELVKGSSNKGLEWLHPFIDEGGEFDHVIIPAEQVIPIYEGSKQKQLQYALRYYTVTVNGKTRKKVEWYDKNQVTYYIQGENQEFRLDDTEEVNPASHFYLQKGSDMTGYGWGRVPLIPFKNNEEEKSDLTFYKALIDAFDLSVSNVMNNVEEIQSIIWILKGYEGTSLEEFMTNLRKYKAIGVDEQGGVDTKQAETPIATVDSILDRLEDSIFTFGQGVNVKSDKYGNSPSGIALKFLYSLLDLKCNILERKFRKSLQIFMWFIAEYFSIKDGKQYDYKSVAFTFNRSMLVNESEQVDIAQKSKGIISDDTIMANHPWVDDVEAEKERLEEQQPVIDLDHPSGEDNDPE